jgi:phenylalanine-4-hydroxylase
VKALAPKAFGPRDQDTWRLIISAHEKKRNAQLCDIFLNGVRILGLTADRIPDLGAVNAILRAKTGFEGVLVEGLEDGASFFRMLAEGRFPIGNFIRDQKDLSYTPAPDIVHDLYGHLPYFTDPRYAEFWRSYARAACEFAAAPALLRQFERFYWFCAEFSLLKTPQGTRILGAGIASSTGECDYALSDAPRVEPFDIDRIRHQEFRIDEMQKLLFRFESLEQLYGSLPELQRRVRADGRGVA